MDKYKQNEVTRYRFELNNGHISVECVPDDILEIIREQVEEEHRGPHGRKRVRIEYKALDHKVLAVALEGSAKDWTAYIGAVAGESHRLEMEEVRRHGSKLPFYIASFLFPDFARHFTWRP